MRAIFGFVSLLVVLAIVAVTARNQLRAARPLLPASAPADASAASSAPFGGTSSPSVAQFQQELDKTMREAADRAASASADVDTVR